MTPDPLGEAVRTCPFLRNAAASQGEAWARNLAQNPFANASAGPLLLEDGLSSFAATLRLFHGPGGVVPLKRFGDGGGADRVAAPSQPAAVAASGCPFRSTSTAAASQPAESTAMATSECSPAVPATVPVGQPCSRSAVAAATGSRPLAHVPFASLSLSGFGFVPDPGQLFNNRPPRAKQQRSQQQQQQRKPTDVGGGSGSSSTGRAGATSGSSPGASSGGSSGSGTASCPGPASGGSHSHGHSHAPRGSAGTQGWGKVFGGLIPLAAGGHLQCPAAVVKMRAAVAALKPVRQLRPQALPVRALAMGATTVAANLPCGAWREHTRKFSPQWFLAVHATIPFVAMLRKAVLMPKWAILLTLAGAIAGQSVGARMERERLRQLSSRRRPAAPARQAGRAGAATAELELPQEQPPPASDCVMPGLDAGCRSCLQSVQAAIAWTLAPTVVQ